MKLLVAAIAPITTPTASYRILRSPRTIGDETLKLPDSTLIDLNPNLGTVVGNPTLTSLNPNPLPPIDAANVGTNYVDILFSPSGTVISKGITTDKINLWVRAPISDKSNSEYDPFRGAPTIVAVFVQTGFTGAFPPNPNTPGNPYSLVK